MIRSRLRDTRSSVRIVQPGMQGGDITETPASFRKVSSALGGITCCILRNKPRLVANKNNICVFKNKTKHETYLEGKSTIVPIVWQLFPF